MVELAFYPSTWLGEAGRAQVWASLGFFTWSEDFMDLKYMFKDIIFETLYLNIRNSCYWIIL
jgi:hypothetical protein